MNFQDKEPILSSNKVQTICDMSTKEKTSLKYMNQQMLSPFHKKEKRNRKFFMKRTIMLLIIEKETGNINFEKGSDFAHLEIMQGGHFPMNKYAMKDIKSETFNNENEAKEHNIGVCLQQAALSLSNHCLTIRTQKQYKFNTNQQSSYSDKSKQQQKFNQGFQQEKRQSQSISGTTISQVLGNQQQKQYINEELEILKDKLRKQHQAILQSII